MMSRIKSIRELETLRDQSIRVWQRRGSTVLVSMGTSAIAAGAGDIMRALADELKETGIPVVRTGSLGLDKCEPVVSVERGGKTVIFGEVTHDGARKIAAYAKGGKIASEWVIAKF